MKRIFFTLTVVLSLISFSSFAGDDITPAALQSFKSSFKNATDVVWTTTSNHYKATFALNGIYVSAYYDANGKMAAVTRNISSLQLPVTLQTSLKKDHENFWISDLFEMANEDGTTYYATLEDADYKIVMKSTSTSGWSVYKKMCKS